MEKRFIRKKNYNTLLDLIREKDKIAILGSGGSGKTTLAKKIARDLSYSLVCLDEVYWGENWTFLGDKEFYLEQKTILQQTAKIVIEGTYENHLAARLECCDAIIMIDCNPLKCLMRVIVRSLRNRNTVRSGMAKGCTESLSLEYVSFLIWVLQFQKVKREIEKVWKKENPSIFYVDFKV